ncbi:DNA-3-methyladenine glycosylase 2 family protein [Pararhodobacter sp. SW119]|uniref:DNA-3-methyladenine glycosylase family protein n=1 Tax=Pararhodobacter sp. SW119 TaxID=2780075 RepID=UPI001ADEE96C|nr:DNA-3-methyladenine glycosylase 2 family protein [Pararhodobacter sp. SW119]
MTLGRILTTDDCMREGAAWLARAEPRFAAALDLCGTPPLRRRADGFAALMGAIVSQQVSTAAARAIQGRLDAAGLTEPAAIVAADDEALRTAGLSRQKIRYIRALAQAGIDFDALRTAPDDQVVATLVEIPGIGRWTAEIYAMFSLGRADVFAPNDLALQESARLLFELPDRPKERALREFAQPWSPWRTVAAGMLWHYYHHAKNREGIA